MGRRSTKTTKAGKFMNPTDQWRKEQRRKELKKNKKQRTAVREAVLRMKDPVALLQEIEEIEKAESELPPTALPNEKGLLDKKRKLHGNLDRIVKYWQKEDPKKAYDVKQLILESEKKRRETTQLYDSYKEARSQCEVSDIPLPDTSDGTYIMPSDIPMPDELVPPPGHTPSIATPPGPPPGAPPSDLRGYNIVETSLSQPKRSVRFAAAEDNKSEEEKERAKVEDEEEEEEEGSSESSDSEEDFDPDAPLEAPPVKSAPPTAPQIPPPPPAGPPPLFPPRFPPPSAIRLPPGPPPGLPPGLRPPSLFPPPPPPQISAPPSRPHIQSQAVLSSRPRPSSTGERGGRAAEQGAVISAQPQLRNIQAEVTKFMPTSLRVRREVPKQSAGKLKTAKPTQAPSGLVGVAREGGRGSRIQGDAYEAFMKEMEGFL